MSDELFFVRSLPETESQESKLSICFSFLSHKTRWWRIISIVTLADSIHSVGVVSGLTTLETVPPLPVIETIITTPVLPSGLDSLTVQSSSGAVPDSNASFPHHPQCKRLFSNYLKSALSHLLLIVVVQGFDSFFSCLDNFPCNTALGSVSVSWYNQYLRDILRESI